MKERTMPPLNGGLLWDQLILPEFVKKTHAFPLKIPKDPQKSHKSIEITISQRTIESLKLPKKSQISYNLGRSNLPLPQEFGCENLKKKMKFENQWNQ